MHAFYSTARQPPVKWTAHGEAVFVREPCKKTQIPPDLVVKSQGIDIIGLILPLIRGQNVVETSRRHMKSRFELLSPSKGNWFTTKSDGMWD
jgi:hypothetical protein